MSHDSTLRRVGRRWGRRGGLLAGVLWALLFVGVVGAGVAVAYWVTTDNSYPGVAKGDTLPTGATPTSAVAAPNPNSNSVAVTFAQAVTAAGTPVTASRYRINRYSGAAGSLEETVTSPSCVAGVQDTVVCTVTDVPDGTWTFTDTATYGAHWVGPESGRSPVVQVDTALPTVAITYPVSGSTYGPNWTGTITGTAGDTGDSMTVSLTIQDTTNGQWWNGAGWQNGTTAVTPSGTTGWSYAFDRANLTDDHRYSVVATGTDSFGNVGVSPASSFGVDIVDPPHSLPVSITDPSNAAVYGANWSGQIAGTAGDPSGDLTSVDLVIRDTTAAPVYRWWNGSSWQGTDPQEALAASSTTSWTYPLAAGALESGHTYDITATAVDKVGNDGTANATFTYRTTAPAVEVTYPATGTTYGANWSGALSGTAGAASGLTITSVAFTLHNISNDTWWNGSFWQGTTASVHAAGTTSWGSTLSEYQLINTNQYTLVATATDSGGNTNTTSATWQWIVTEPSVAVTYPLASYTYGTNWTGTIGGTAAANGTGLSLVAPVLLEVEDATNTTWWNGSAWTGTPTHVTASGTTAWTYALAAGNLTTTHTYTVHAHATDSGGNTATSTALGFTYVTTTPSGAVAYPTDGTTYGTNWAELLEGPAGAGTGLTVANVTLALKDTTTGLWWDGATFANVSQTFTPASGTISWQYALSKTALTDGDSYSVTVRTTDNAGNIYTAGSPVTWSYRTSTPSVAVTYPINSTSYGAGWTGTVTGTQAANGTGLSVGATSTALAIEDTTTNRWWTGAAFTAAGETYVTTTAGSPYSSWTYGLSAAGNLASGHGYTIKARTIDSGGNTAESTVAFTYDLTTPTAVVTYPATGATYGSAWGTTLRGSASAAAGKTVSSVTLTIEDTTNATYWTGSTWSTSTTVTPTGSTAWTYDLTADHLTTTHVYTVSVDALDSGGNHGYTSAAWTYNTALPTVSTTYPLNTYVYGPNWAGTVTGTATAGSDLNLTSVTVAVKDTTTGYWFDGIAFTASSSYPLPATGTTSWSYPVELAHLTHNHVYTVLATATNNAGNTHTSSTVTFTVDTAAPTVTITYPVNGTTYGPNWTGTITGTASDPGNDLTATSLSILDVTAAKWWNGTSWQTTVTSVAASGTTNWSYGLAVDHLTDTHTYTVVASASDYAANVGTSATTTFKADIINPLPIAITYPANAGAYGVNWAGSITGTAGDPDGDLSAVALEVKDTTTTPLWWNGSGWQSTTITVPATSLTSWSYSLSSGALASGHNYSITATARDTVANIGSTTSTFTYNTAGISATAACPVSGTTYGGNWASCASNGYTPLTGTATATVGTVASVALTVRNTTASPNQYWNGLFWQTTPTTVAATLGTPTDGTYPWTYALSSLQLVNTNNYSLVAVATNSLDNTATTTPTTWTYDTTAPTVTVGFPLASTTYHASSWTGAVTGSASAHGSLTLTATTIVAIQDATAGTWWNGSAFAAGSQTYLSAVGTSSWSYALPSSALSSGHSYAVQARVTDSGGNTGTSGSSTFSYFVASKVVVTVQPSNSLANAAINPAVKVSVEDAAGNVATTDNATTVSLSLGTNPAGGTLTGGGAVSVVSGVATFPNLSLDKVGNGYTLTAVSSGLTGATSNTFNISVGAAAKLAFTTQPSSVATSGAALGTQPVVTVQDSSGNTVTTSAAAVTLTASSGSLVCTTNPVNAVAGVATFAGCKITGSGTVTLTAASTGLTSTTSTTISLGSTVAPPTAVTATNATADNKTLVHFTASNPTTGVASYTCSIYLNNGGSAGALITSAACTAGSNNAIQVPGNHRGTNTIVVIVTANASPGYTSAASIPVVGSVA